MMLTQCSGSEKFSLRRVALLAHVMVPCAAPHALVVDHVALALDERGFGRGAAQIAIPHATCAHGNKVAEDAVFKTPCVVIIFDEAP